MSERAVGAAEPALSLSNRSAAVVARLLAKMGSALVAATNQLSHRLSTLPVAGLICGFAVVTLLTIQLFNVPEE